MQHEPRVRGGSSAGGTPSGRTRDGRAWPPQPPAGRKPGFGEPGAAEWRYQRYLQKAHARGKGPDDVKSFDDWRRTDYEAAANGGRPGRRGGADQQAAKDYLRDEHGVEPVENVRLGPQYVDGVRTNDRGGTDYFEVGAGLQNGLPEARERAKLANEVGVLGDNDTLNFVNKTSPEPDNWIRYNRGDDPHTKRAR